MKTLLEDVRITKIILMGIYQEIDGFYVFDPTQRYSGFLTEGGLRRIADVLEDLNWSWDQQINTYFETHK